MTRLSEYAENKLNKLVDDKVYFTQKQLDNQTYIINIYANNDIRRHLLRENDLYKIESTKISKEIKDTIAKYSGRNNITKSSTDGYYTVVSKNIIRNRAENTTLRFNMGFN